MSKSLEHLFRKETFLCDIFLHQDTCSKKWFFYHTHLKFRIDRLWGNFRRFTRIHLISPMASSKKTLYWNFDNGSDNTVAVTIRLDVSLRWLDFYCFLCIIKNHSLSQLNTQLAYVMVWLKTKLWNSCKWVFFLHDIMNCWTESLLFQSLQTRCKSSHRVAFWIANIRIKHSNLWLIYGKFPWSLWTLWR